MLFSGDPPQCLLSLSSILSRREDQQRQCQQTADKESLIEFDRRPSFRNASLVLEYINRIDPVEGDNCCSANERKVSDRNPMPHD